MDPFANKVPAPLPRLKSLADSAECETRQARPMNDEEIAAKRRAAREQEREYRLQACFQVLVQADAIRKDDALMRDIKLWLRKQKDDFSAAADLIGG